MLSSKYAMAGAAALTLFAIPSAAQAVDCICLNALICNPFTFAGGSELMRFSVADAEGVIADTGTLGFRRGGGPRRGIGHKRPRGNCGAPDFRVEGSPAVLQSGLDWTSSTNFGDDVYSLDSDYFAADWLTLSGTAGAINGNDAGSLTGLRNDGFFLGGGITAYATRNFAFDAYADYTDETLYGVSANSRFGAEFLPFSGVPLSLYSSYDRTDFAAGGVYDLISAGLTFYIGAPRKGDLRSYHRGN